MAGFGVGAGDGGDAGGELLHGIERGFVGEGAGGETPDVAEGHGAEAFGFAAGVGAHGAMNIEDGGAVDRDAAELVGGAVEEVFKREIEVRDADIRGTLAGGERGSERSGKKGAAGRGHLGSFCHAGSGCGCVWGGGGLAGVARREGADARAGEEDAGEVERIGGSGIEGGEGFRQFAPNPAEEIESFGARKLFAGEARDEAAAADGSPRFHAAQDGEQVAPGGSDGFAGEQIAKDDAPAQEQLAGDGLRAFGEGESSGDVTKDGPTSGGVAGTGEAFTAFTATPFGIDEGAEIFEAVGGDESGGDQFPESVLDFAREAADGADDVGEEAGSELFEGGKHVAGGVGEVDCARHGRRHEPGGVFTEEEGDGSDASGADVPGVSLFEGGVRGDAAPHELAGEAEAIDEFGVVGLDAAGEDLALPGRGGDLVALQLANDLEGAFDAPELSAGRGVLPAVEEVMELESGDGFDFAAEAAEREAVNAGEDAAVAPFDAAGGGETALEDLAFGFKKGERLLDFADGEGDLTGERERGDGASGFHPAAERGGGVGGERKAFGGDPECLSAARNGGCAAGGGEFVEPGSPFGGGGQGDEGQERVVEFVGVADSGPGIAARFIDCRGVEDANSLGEVGSQGSAQLHGAGAALLERGVIEEGVGIGIENFVGERGGLGGFDGDGADRAVMNGGDDAAQRINVHGFMKAVGDGFPDEGMIGDANGAGEILGAGDLIGENGGEEVGGAHALDGWGDLAATGEAGKGESAGGIPAPAGGEERSGEKSLREDVFESIGAEEFEDEFEGEGMPVAERDDDAVVGGGGLQFEVEGAAEALAEGEAPGAIDTGSEGSVQDKLHAAGFVEEALGDDGIPRGQGSESGGGRLEVGDGLARAGFVEGAFGHEELRGFRAAPDYLFPDAGDFGGEFGGPARGFAEPEGDGGRGSLGVLDADAAGFDALDAPGMRAEEEDVTGHAFDSEVFVESTDGFSVRLGDDGIVGVVGDGSAGGDGGEAGSAAAFDAAVDAVAMEEGPGAPARGGDAFGEHVEDGVEIGAGKGAVGVGGADGLKQPVLFPGFG